MAANHRVTTEGSSRAHVDAAIVHQQMPPFDPCTAPDAAWRRAEARRRALFSASMDAILTTTVTGAIVDANPAACSLFGGSLAELVSLGAAWLDAGNEASSAAVLAELASTGQFRGELRLRRQDGDVFHGAVSAVGLANPEGEQEFNFIIHDITSRKAGQERRGQFATVLANVPAAVISTDRDLGIRTWNAAAERMYGWRAAEVMGRDIDDVCQTRFIGVAQSEAQAALATDGHWQGELEQRTRTGDILIVQSSVSLLRDELGVISGGVAINLDITEQRRTAQELAASAQHFRALIENIDEGIAIMDAEANLRYVSQSAARVLGHTSQELMGPTALVIHPDDVDAAAEVLAQVLHTPDKPLMHTLRVNHKDGSWRWIEATVTNMLADWAVRAIVVNFRDITERRLAESELAASNARFRSLFDTMTLGVVYHEADGRITLANAAAQEILGLSLDQMQGRTSTDPSWRTVREDGTEFPGAEHPAMVALRTGRIVTDVMMGVYHPLRNDQRWIRIAAVPEFRPGEGAPFRVFAIFDDITAWRRTEQALATSEANYRKAIGAAGAIAYSTDYAANCYTFMSPEIERLTGYTRADFTPDHFAAMIVDAVPTGQNAGLSFAEASARSRRNRGAPLWQCDYRLRTPAGEERWVYDVAVHLFDDGDTAIGAIGILQDITERKRAEAALRTSEERYRRLAAELEQRVAERTAELQTQRDFARQVMDALGQGLVVSDQAGRAVYANPAMAELLETTSAALLGARLSDYVSAEELPLLQALFPRHLYDETFQFEINVMSATGRHKPLLISTSPRRKDGELIGRIGVFTDLTQIKAIETSLRQSRDELRAANTALENALRMKDEFLASMSHELRTPLTGILGLSEALQMQTYGILNERQARSLNTIWQSGRHLLALINDILDLSMVAAGQIVLADDRCDVNDLCESSLGLIAGMAQNKQQKVSSSITPAGMWLYGDPRRLKQILVNLLSNAVKFTPVGGKLGLTARGDREHAQIEFVVWDNGIGIAAEDIPRLFQPFTQLDSRLTREYAGTGLGLALAQGMAELHGGTIRVESRPEDGSAFTLVVPWRDDEASARGRAGASAQDARPDAPSAPTATGHLVLLVEDDRVGAELLADVLALQGYRVEHAVNGVEAVQKVGDVWPDLILMDIRLPLMNGLDAIKQIRAMPGPVHTTPIIALTAQAMQGDAEQCLAAGADAYLTKPYQIEVVLEAVRQSFRAP